jgi:hypothetical protein
MKSAGVKALIAASWVAGAVAGVDDRAFPNRGMESIPGGSPGPAWNGAFGEPSASRGIPIAKSGSVGLPSLDVWYFTTKVADA